MSANSNIDSAKPSGTEKAQGRTGAEGKLWQAMLDKPDTTAADCT